MWNDFGGCVGWTGWLVAALAMLVFWGAVIVGLWALFQIPWPADRRHRSARRGDFVSRDGHEAPLVHDATRCEPLARAAVPSGSKPISPKSRAQPEAQG